ncbi:MAG: SDR family oxidoreductase [Gammaproteobacteria bacterium AqS3]|nr:SDR family oxidoreductase [Gammaproteobacteria bacterium AqS3]
MYQDLSGKVAVVTGSGREAGIGFAIARRLHEEGCSVVLTDIGAPRGEHFPSGAIGELDEMRRLADALGAEDTLTLACDVTSETDVAAAVQAVVATHGRLDIWVNNAGVGYLMKPIVEMSVQEWDTVLDVNLRGAFLGIKYAGAQMQKQGAGSIINIGSQASKSGFGHASAYTASKHGLVGLTRSAALELGESGVRVNTVCPNHITTGLGAWQNSHFSQLQGLSEDDYLAAMRARIPLGRPGRQRDIADACAFLASDQACYVTGECMNVSGGEEYH